MAVVFVEGFDMYNGTGTSSSTSVGMGVRWSVNGGSLVAGRFGGQAIYYPGTGASNKSCQVPLPGSYSAGTIGFAIYLSGSYGAFPSALVVLGAQFNLIFNSDSSLSVRRGATVIGTTATGVLTLGAWNYLEIEYVISPTVGQVRIYVSGTNVLSLSGVNNQNNASGTVSYIILCDGSYALAGLNVTIDDLYVTDTDTRLGEQRVVTTYPDADVTNSNWTANSGSALYSRINETLCDGDTSYIYAGTLNATATFATQNLPVVPNNVQAVQISSFARKTDTGFRTMELQYINAGGSVAASSSYTLVGGYGKQVYLNTVNPLTSAPWTAAEINAMKVGVKVTA